MPAMSLASVSLRRSQRPELRPDSYLTDGLRLFRVVMRFEAGSEPVAAQLEDCMTLEVRAYGPAELYDMGLRLVRAEAGEPA